MPKFSSSLLNKIAYPGDEYKDIDESPDLDHLTVDEDDLDSELVKATSLLKGVGWTSNGLYNADEEDEPTYKFTKDKETLYVVLHGESGLSWFFENSSEEGHNLASLEEALKEPEEESDFGESLDEDIALVRNKFEQGFSDAFGEEGVWSAKDFLSDLIHDNMQWYDESLQSHLYAALYKEFIEPLEDENRVEEYESAAEGIVQIIRENESQANELDQDVDHEGYVRDMAEASQPRLNADLLNDYVSKLLKK